MSESLRDQLLKSGLAQKLKSEAKPAPHKSGPHKPAVGKPSASAGRPAAPHKPQHHAKSSAPREGAQRGEPDLAQAYAQRARMERTEREQAQREAEQRAKEKRERKQKLAALLDGKALNIPDAEHPRHFPHHEKIRRIYCTPDQLAALNRGELGVVQKDGRYLLVSRELATQVQAVAAEALVLLVDPNAPADDDVPADLMW
jgi:uncharacterized protein YaiL (DUF2058 family)